ncbi:MAG: YggT family protein [Polaromonas sp.]|nr:YggT family protein [Polaromonas sp.]
MHVLVFLLDTVFFVLVCAALLRAWLNGRRIGMYEQPGPFIMAVTNWLVMPLRRTLPTAWQRSRWDLASGLAALLLVLLHAGLLMALWGQMGGHGRMSAPWEGAWLLPAWLGLAVQLLLRAAIQGLLLLVLLYAVLSWVQPHAPVQQWLARLLAPLLRPIQRIIPLVGGVDLSPLVLLLLLQVGLMVLG